MIESIMFFALGFLISSLLGLIILPLVHARAVRLTTRRIEASAPVSMAEIQAGKDQLRAEFAMSTRRLEMSVEQLKAKTARQLTELGKQADAINKLKAELSEKSATIAALNARETTLQEQLRSIDGERGGVTDARAAADHKLTEKAGLEEPSVAADNRRIEIVTLRTQVARLRDQVSDLEQQVKQAEGRASRGRLEVEKATHELAEERSKAEKLGMQLEQLQRQLAAQAAEPEMLKSLREETTPEAPLERGSESERMENALLRERINDVSAQVASLTAALEGPDSPIAAILAGDTAAHDEPVNGTQNGAAPIALTGANGSLADRIRALQSRAASRTGLVR